MWYKAIYKDVYVVCWNPFGNTVKDLVTKPLAINVWTALVPRSCDTREDPHWQLPTAKRASWVLYALVKNTQQTHRNITIVIVYNYVSKDSIISSHHGWTLASHCSSGWLDYPLCLLAGTRRRNILSALSSAGQARENDIAIVPWGGPTSCGERGVKPLPSNYGQLVLYLGSCSGGFAVFSLKSVCFPPSSCPNAEVKAQRMRKWVGVGYWNEIPDSSEKRTVYPSCSPSSGSCFKVGTTCQSQSLWNNIPAYIARMWEGYSPVMGVAGLGSDTWDHPRYQQLRWV